MRTSKEGCWKANVSGMCGREGCQEPLSTRKTRREVHGKWLRKAKESLKVHLGGQRMG